MKYQKGFIKSIIFITIITSVLIVGGIGYIGVKQYQNYQTKKIEKERIAQEKEKEAQALAETQQKALTGAQQEIEKLKQESAQTKQKQTALEQNIKEATPKDLSISATELSSYLEGIVRIDCDDWWGSGSLWKRNDLGFSVITNYHVIENAKSCLVLPEDKAKDEYIDAALINDSSKKLLDSNKDVAFIQILSAKNMFPSDGKPVKSLDKFNYNIGTLQFCIEKMPVGSPVVTIGFPAFAVREISFQGYKSEQYFQIVSDGIISGHDESVNNPYWGNLPFQNYFVSARIDSGNSGGIAISKTTEGILCILGIPTWLTIGNYETQGLVQNIHNVMYKE